MSWDLLTVALLAGVANWAFRALPIISRTDRQPAGGWLERFLSATGPAAIATLLVASLLPLVTPDPGKLLAVVIGIVAVLVTYYRAGSVVLATLAGAFAHGAAVWLLG